MIGIKVFDDDRCIMSVKGFEIPKDAKFREAYETETEIVVCGYPEDPEEDHNCDQMGCTASHVLYRFKK